MLNRGSEWRRWEPHIHAPGTVLNDQFGGREAWTNYLTKLESVTPKIEAIGVTDYYITDTLRRGGSAAYRRAPAQTFSSSSLTSK